MLMLEKEFQLKCISLVSTKRKTQKKVSYAHKAPNNVAPTIFMQEKNVN